MSNLCIAALKTSSSLLKSLSFPNCGLQGGDISPVPPPPSHLFLGLFAGWRDTENVDDPLVYILLASRRRAGHYHEFCVYKGSRAEHSAFLPPGFQESGFVVSVSVLVQDQLGATVVAINR